MQILRKTEEIIYPAAIAIAHPTLFRLSETDQLRYAVGRLYFYKQGPASSEALKSSLRKTLAFFYTFTGRLVERTQTNGGDGGESKGTCEAAIGGQEDDQETCPDAIRHGGTAAIRHGRRVDVSCLDQGALFCEAWTDTRLDAYQPDFQPHPDFSDVLAPGFGPDDVFLLRVQITYFSCGGICLCVQDHHCLVDGVASSHFMKCWVEISNGEESPSVCPYISHPPLEEVYIPKDLHNSCIEDFSTYYQSWPSSATQEDYSTSYQSWSSSATQEISNKIFHFTPKFIDNLKSETSHERCKYSSFECITAFMWKILTLARGIASNEEVCLYYPIDGRGKLEPPLPPSYFGNVVFHTHASVKVSGLVENPLSHITNLIREATSKVTDAHIRSMVKWSTRQPFPMSSNDCLSPHIFLNSWKNFPLCDFNFGWGNPSCCRVGLIPFECVILLPSSLGRGHIDVLVALNKYHMKNLDSLLSQTPLF